MATHTMANDLVPSDSEAPSTTDEKAIFAYLTHPDDSYTPEGVYWADLPLRQRVAFVGQSQGAEATRELKATWALFRRNPLGPLAWYFRNAVVPGAGLGLEGYVLFSIGNLEPLFAAAWPRCWKTHEVCSAVASVTYLEVVGIMVGQVGVGFLGDGIGRRWGLIQDAAVMLVGLVILAASWGRDLNGWVVCYAVALFIYGVGVGGEYPVTATSSMETAVGRPQAREDRMHRGRRVTLAFLMQGWGQLVNQAVLMVLLVALQRGRGDGPYEAVTAQWLFRLSFVLPAIGTLWLLYYRAFKMRDASKLLSAAKKKGGVAGYDVRSMKLTLTHFGGRLWAASMGWFCNDVFFYGNKLFQGQFIKVVSPGSSDSLMTGWQWNLVNVVVSLLGYHAASLLIDNKLYGRKTMQQVGFLMCFIMFVVPAFHYRYYSHPEGVHAFQAMYFLSSFFNQFGPNSVTFLVAGEMFPTPVRASAHGFSACVGKAGALLASVLYNYVDTQTKFYVVPWFGLAGSLITCIWLPDTTGLDLHEQERRWAYVRAGREHEYCGVAVHPRHLSLWERLRGVGRNYDPEADRRAKIEDLRAEWEAQRRATAEAELGGATSMFAAQEDWSDDVHDYFLSTRSRETTPAGDGGIKDEVTDVK